MVLPAKLASAKCIAVLFVDSIYLFFLFFCFLLLLLIVC